MLLLWHGPLGVIKSQKSMQRTEGKDESSNDTMIPAMINISLLSPCLFHNDSFQMLWGRQGYTLFKCTSKQFQFWVLVSLWGFFCLLGFFLFGCFSLSRLQTPKPLFLFSVMLTHCSSLKAKILANSPSPFLLGSCPKTLFQTHVLLSLC